MALTTTELDRASCSTPGCTATHEDLYFHAKCHPKKGTSVRYLHGKGVVVITCKQCGALIVEVAVAKGFVQ